MKENLKQYIQTKKTKTLTLTEVYENLHLPYNPENDQIIHKLLKQLEEEKIIIPLKTAKKNYRGMSEKYRILSQNEDDTIKKEILKLNSKLQINYYLKHPEEYLNDKSIILPINDFISKKCKASTNKEELTLNERSYQIYKNEKMLKANEDIIKKLGLNYKELNCYETYEPFFYYINENYNEKNTEKLILIIENKDTFWTIEKAIKKLNLNHIYTVIYGEGKKILKSFSFINELNINGKYQIQYFGDIDFEGINIYEALKEKYKKYEISAYKIGYEAMLKIENEPQKIRTAQTINIEKINEFLKEFSPEYQEKLTKIFESKKYIPQEVFNFEVIKQTYCEL